MNKKLTHGQIEDLLSAAKHKFRLTHSDKEGIRISLMKQLKNQPQSVKYSTRPGIAMLAPAIMAVVVAVTSGTAAFANSAKPGDILYPVDQFMERIETKLVINSNTKAQLYASFSQERAEELTLLEADQPKTEDKAQSSRWAKSHEEAEIKVANSIEQLDQVEAIFDDKLSSETNDAKKAVYQTVLDHLRATESRRDDLLSKIETRGDKDKSGGTQDDKEIKARIKARLQVTPEAKSKIIDQITQDFTPEKRRTKSEQEVDDLINKNRKFWDHILPGRNGSRDGSSVDKPSSTDGPEPESGPCDSGKTIPDPDNPDICYGNNSLIESGVNQIIKNKPIIKGF